MIFDCFVDNLYALARLLDAFPIGKWETWKCRRCGIWLGALDLEGGLVAGGTFGYHVEYWDDPYLGGMPHTAEVVLTNPWLKERCAIKCERCGAVNRRRRRG